MISDINNKILNNLKESVESNKLDVNKIAQFLEKAVVDLTTTDYTCSWYDLDKDLAIFVGWTEGYDPDDTDYIHDEKEPNFVLAAKIASTHEYMKTDLDWLTQPYYEDGEVWDTEITISPNENYEEDAKWFIDSYNGIKKALDNGELLLESKKVIKENDTEYAINIKDKASDKFKYQYDVYKTYEDAVKSAKSLNLKPDEIFNIVKINYDENGNELGIDIIDESSNNSDLEKLANDIIDWYGNDMGTYFDEIKGNEEDLFNETLAILENKDKKQIQHFIDDIEDANITERLKVIINESALKEDSWVHFSFEDGSNPYIAKTEKEANRILRKYKDRAVKIKDGFYTIKKEKEINESKETKRVYMVLGNYGEGWETVYTSEDKADAEERLKEYNENEREYPHKIMSKRADLFDESEKALEEETLNEDKYSDSTWYEYDIDGNKFNFLCRSWERSNAWGHEVELKSGYSTISTARVRYYNRTWEMFTYQTCMLKAVDNWIDSLSTGAIDQYKSMNDVSKLKSGQRQEILDADKNYILAKKLYDAVSKGRGLQESEEQEFKETEVIKHTDKHSVLNRKKKINETAGESERDYITGEVEAIIDDMTDIDIKKVNIDAVVDIVADEKIDVNSPEFDERVTSIVRNMMDNQNLNEEQEDKVEGLNVYQDKYVAKAFKQAVIDGVFSEDQVDKVLTMLATDDRLSEEENK